MFPGRRAKTVLQEDLPMPHLLNNKYFLYATEFFSGMSVMAIELGASRLLAPYFSSSQIVWTVIIGTIMIAMALGNIWGGRIVDRNPDPSRLYRRLLFAAVWIAAIPFLGKYVIALVSIAVGAVTSHNFLLWASFLCCFVIFVFPLVMLSTVTPSLTRFTMESLSESGRTVGRLNALNTIGSIIGTFLPTFVTIPAIGTAATFILFAGILALLSTLYFLSVRTGLRRCLVSIVLIVACSVSTVQYSFAFWEKNLVYEDESIYNYLQVRETDTSVILSTNVLAGVQSIKMKQGSLTGMYYDYALAAPVMAGLHEKEDGSVLILGLGTGTFATLCREYFPGATVEGVEIDQKIADLAKTYFDLPDSVTVHVADGRTFLTGAGRYDVIMVDAYQDITIPFQMSSVEFFTEVRNHLAEDGIMVVNMNMRSDREGAINDYLTDTIGSVFPSVVTAPVRGGTNTELFAAAKETDLPARLTEALPGLREENLAQMMQTVADVMETPALGRRILTDDKAPVEVLGMRVIDEIIADELEYYRKEIQAHGLRALFS